MKFVLRSKIIALVFMFLFISNLAYGGLTVAYVNPIFSCNSVFFENTDKETFETFILQEFDQKSQYANYTQAFYRLIKNNAQKGDVKDMFRFAELNFYGNREIKKNFLKAFEYYEKAKNSGSSEAIFKLAIMPFCCALIYKTNYPRENNVFIKKVTALREQSISLLKSGIESGHLKSQKTLFLLYKYGYRNGTPNIYLFGKGNYEINFSTAIEYLKLNKNQWANFEIAKLYVDTTAYKYGLNADIKEIKNLFLDAGQLDYFNSEINKIYYFGCIRVLKLKYPKIFNFDISINYENEPNVAELIKKLESYQDILGKGKTKTLKWQLIDNLTTIYSSSFIEFETERFNYIINSNDIKDLNAFIKKFPNSKFRDQAKSRFSTLDEELYNIAKSTNSEESYKKYLAVSENGLFRDKARNNIENIRSEIIRQESLKKEQRERYLAYYKPQMEAYNLLASKYANKYKREISPNTGIQSSYEFIQNDFDKDQRYVKLKWIAAICTLCSKEQFEIEGILNVREGTFEWDTSNSAVSAAQNIGGMIKVSSDFIADAYKSLPQSDYSNYSSSSSNTEASNNLSDCETDCLKEWTREKIKSTRDWEKRTLSQSLEQLIEFSGGYYGFIFKDEDNKYYIDTKGTGLDYYKDYNSVVFSLYVYKRCGNVAKTNKLN